VINAVTFASKFDHICPELHGTSARKCSEVHIKAVNPTVNTKSPASRSMVMKFRKKVKVKQTVDIRETNESVNNAKCSF
jgi:hypothetical protein